MIATSMNESRLTAVTTVQGDCILPCCYMPKCVQEKRTKGLENRVDRMSVTHFSEWTREVIHQWRENTVLHFVPKKFDWLCGLWQYVEHYTLQQAHIIVLLIMQLTAKYQLNLQDVSHMNITKWTVSHRTASPCSAWFVIMDNVQHTTSLEHF